MAGCFMAGCWFGSGISVDGDQFNVLLYVRQNHLHIVSLMVNGCSPNSFSG